MQEICALALGLYRVSPVIYRNLALRRRSRIVQGRSLIQGTRVDDMPFHIAKFIAGLAASAHKEASGGISRYDGYDYDICG